MFDIKDELEVIPEDAGVEELLKDGLRDCAHGALLLYEYISIKSDAEISNLINQIHGIIQNRNFIPVKKSR